ncbi:MAG: abortive infection family protein [Acidobacteriota bacterium]|nr:abortive infection family protein [Acidobacteriota bacterium]
MLFTQRHTPTPRELRYDVPEEVRSRLLAVLRDAVLECSGEFEAFLAEVGRTLFKRYGTLSKSGYIAARRSENPFVEHFFTCHDEQVLDFLEVCLQKQPTCGGQKTVDEINEILRETGIGYHFTPLIEHSVEKQFWLVPGRKSKGVVVEYDYPKAIRADNQLIHQSVTEPTLHFLSDRRFKIANSEVLKAHKALRSGEFDDAITDSASAFESLLKTICDVKGWTYDKNRDTCSRLLDICQKNGLFPSFYKQCFESICAIRNKIGDAHGRGPIRDNTAQLEHAEHMIHLTCSNMLFLAKLAELA